MDVLIAAWTGLIRKSATASSMRQAPPVAAVSMDAGSRWPPVLPWSWLESKMPLDDPHRADPTAKRICELALAEDALAQQAVEREAHYPGIGAGESGHAIYSGRRSCWAAA